jgi:uncharacterized OB-fold protein
MGKEIFDSIDRFFGEESMNRHEGRRCPNCRRITPEDAEYCPYCQRKFW